MESRFWSKVKIGSLNDCWEWTGNKRTDGYGVINVKGKRIRSHRYSWELHNGKIPDNMVICHKCDNPKCVNPYHLFIGTIQDNNADMVQKGRHKLGRVTGIRKHLLVYKGENHGSSKLSDDQIRHIRELYEKSSMTQKEIADCFGIVPQHVSRIVRYEQRK